VGEHHVLGLGILDPMLPRFNIHGAELPAFNRISNALLETTLLLLVIDREPILNEIDAGAN
jgi:hypothetical protein